MGELCGKRLLGYLSWQLRRKHEHRREVLLALSSDHRAVAPDHTAVVGDLTNIALPLEFPPALEWLESLGGPDRISVVPGNHDAYVKLPSSRGVDLWRRYMSGDDEIPSAGGRRAHAFPWVRRRGDIAIIGVSTALPTLPFLATGRAGPEQLARLERVLADLGRAGLFRVVLIHHPPLDALTKWRKRMVDSSAFNALIRRAGAELILHGHTHESTVVAMPGPATPVPVVGVTSASAAGSESALLRARYNVYSISRDSGGWRVRLEARGLRDDGSVGEVESSILTPAGPESGGKR